MPQTKLTAQKEHEIALEALYHDVKGISLNSLSDKYGISTRKIEELLDKGMNGFKSAFYGDSTGASNFLKRYGVSTVNGNNGQTGKPSTVEQSQDDEEEKDLTPEDAMEYIREYNELAMEYNANREDGEPEKKRVAVTVGKIKELTNLSQPKAKEWFEAHLKDINNQNESFEVKADDNKRLKGFDFWTEYHSLKGE